MANRPVDDSGPTGPAIAVDLDGLADLAKTVRRENAATLEPQSNLVRSDLLHGVCFGAASASGQVLEAKQRYHDSLVRALDQMHAHIRAASIIADAAERVAMNYAEADAMSKARTKEVDEALKAAVATADQVRSSYSPQAKAP